jgi:hypothetical protein
MFIADNEANDMWKGFKKIDFFSPSLLLHYVRCVLVELTNYLLINQNFL